jgi:hypothetical protein
MEPIALPINILMDNKVFTQFNQLNQQINVVNSSINILSGKIKKGFDFERFVAFAITVERVGKGLKWITDGGVEFDKSIRELSANTGIAGADLKKLEEQARRTGKDSGMGAASATEVYKTLAAQVDVSKVGIEGLNELQEKTITLAKASGLDITNAATALTGTVNQFGLEATEANRVVNVLAAASIAGAAKIPDLAESFKVVGTTANAAGLSVEQAAGAIEILSQNQVKGAEAGEKLRDIISAMQSGMNIDFGQTSLSSALDSLTPKLSDATYLSQLFGAENVQTAQFLIANAGAVGQMTEQVTGTNTAMKQASVVQESVAEKMARVRAGIDNMKLSLFELTGGYMAYISTIGEMLGDVANLVPVFHGISSAISLVTNAQKMQAVWTGIVTAATKTWAGVQWALNLAMSANPVTWIVVGIIALIAAIVFLASKIKGWGTLWEAVIGFCKNSASTFAEACKLYFQSLVNAFVIPLDQIRKKWYEFRLSMGIGDESENRKAIAGINRDIDDRITKMNETAQKIAAYGKAATGSFKNVKLEWDSETTLAGTTAKLKAQLGIAGQSTVTNNVTNSGPATGSDLSGDLSHTANTITSGGRQVKNYNITINDGLVKEVNNHFSSSSDSPETASDFMWKLHNALQMIVNDVNYATA